MGDDMSWRIEENSWRNTTIVGGDGRTVAELSIDEECSEDSAEGMQKQMARDAKLIQTAPVMLTMLEILVHNSSFQTNHPHESDAIEQLIKRTEA